MAEEDLLSALDAGCHEGERKEEESEVMTLDQMVRLTDETGLIRLGLRVVEAFALREGRTLWH